MSQTNRKGTNLQSVKWQNRAVVLETLWRYQPISRKDLAERTHLTAATLTNIVTELLAAGVVEEIGQGEQRLGRRPTMLSFIKDCRYLIGVNLSRTELCIGLFNMALERQYLLSHPITLEAGEKPVEKFVDLIFQAITNSQVDAHLIAGIGISAPGPLSLKDGVIYSPPNFAEWSNLPLAKIVTQAFNLPVWLDNDANANALAEHWLGAGRPYNNFVYVESHSGLGSGIILNGHLFNGSAGIAAELGHTSIDRHGPRCACGNYGCVELYSSGPAVVRSVREAHADGADTILADWLGSDLDGLTFIQVIQAAQQGDSLARQALYNAACALGLALVNVINLLDPEAVIIGHQLHMAGDLCLQPIREIIAQQAFPQTAARFNVLASELAPPVGITGAACRALSCLLQEPTLLER